MHKLKGKVIIPFITDQPLKGLHGDEAMLLRKKQLKVTICSTKS